MKSKLIDISHVIEAGMTTYPGLPGPVISDHLGREASRGIYGEGTTFQIGRIEMIANTGTYVDSPFHRYGDGDDLAALPLERLADLEGLVVDVRGQTERAIDFDRFSGLDVGGKAVLVSTGWDVNWRTPEYGSGHPFLTRAAATHLVSAGATLVGIDSLNIDDTGDGSRPAHTVLLGAGIPIVEHLRGLDQLPESGFRFHCAPIKFRGVGSFPVRAYAVVSYQ
ncbi:MAG: cyclase family protein [Acidobacteriota bacterium]